jgi:hypothetical protein
MRPPTTASPRTEGLILGSTEPPSGLPRKRFRHPVSLGHTTNLMHLPWMTSLCSRRMGPSDTLVRRCPDLRTTTMPANPSDVKEEQPNGSAVDRHQLA